MCFRMKCNEDPHSFYKITQIESKQHFIHMFIKRAP